MSDITIAIPFVAQTLIGARHAGYDVQRVLKSCGIAPPLLEQPRARVPMDSFVQLLQTLMRLMDDEALGLLDRPQRLGCFNLIARSTLHEADLGGAMQCYVQSTNLFNDGLIHYMTRSGDQVVFGLRVSQGVHLRSTYILESAVMTAHRYFCWLCRERIGVSLVELNYAAPAWEDEYRFLFFGAPVRFNQPEIRVWMDANVLALPVQQDAETLATYIARAPRDMFTPVRSPQVSQQARRYILEQIRKQHGVPRIDATAQALGLSTQTFWRRLKDERTDYTAVRTQARRDTAIALLADPTHSVEMIAERLGFSESSAFIRAFRQWTGMTPLAYRKA